jgi:hypothetical protein
MHWLECRAVSCQKSFQGSWMNQDMTQNGRHQLLGFRETISHAWQASGAEGCP